MTEIQRASVSNWVASHPHWWMSLMLITLHAALAWGIESWWARALMLAHFGFFLMWQPVWRAEREVSTLTGLLIIGVGALLGFVANWWLTALWLGVLIGLIGNFAKDPKGPAKRQIATGWMLKNAMPVKFRVGDLNAKGSDVAIEELHLVHEGLHVAGVAK